MSKKGKKLSLLGDDDDEVSAEELTINKDYADSYDNWRRLEELQKLKDKYGDDAADDDSASSESEVEWTAEDEKGFLKAFSALKTKNPKIYNSEAKFFEKREAPSSSKGDKNDKKEKLEKMYLKDYERKLITERGGQISEDEEDFNTPKPGSHVAEQERLKKELKAAIGDSDDDDGDLLVKREKTTEEQEKEDEDYYVWLKSKEAPKNMDEDIKALKEHWSNDAALDDGEKFLRNYIVNKQYEMDDDEEVDPNAIPTYDQIVSVEEDEADMAREEQFEHKYNYRYEEPDQDFIKQYPRTIKESMRQGNEKRKKEREAYKERKEREKTEKKEEIKQLKKMKRAEIEEKLKKLKKMAGDEELPLNIDDLDEDFDPAKFDQRMKEVFSEKYYGNEDENVEDEEKPEFSDMSEIDSDGDDNYDDMEISTKPVNTEGSDDEEEQQQEDAPQHREKKESRRRKKRNSKFAEAVKKQKPLFDPQAKTFEEYFNDYYALDYEDILGDTRTKFHYRSVPANSFGLSVDEILETDDKQLNAWVSLKKATMYRSEQEEIFDQRAYERKAQNVEKKNKILYEAKNPKKPKADVGDDNSAEQHKVKVEPEEAPAEGEGASKKKRRRNRKSQATDEPHVKVEEEEEVSVPAVKSEPVEEEAPEEANAESGEVSKKKRRRKKPKNQAEQAEVKEEPGVNQESVGTTDVVEKKARTRKRKHNNHEGGKRMQRPEELQSISDERLQAYGLNPKKFVNQFAHQKKRRLEKQ
ncbi:hypothetical protein QR680_005085 [Steinernema hermaphroditum]|uniref:Protein KRI1 homolog n=1 Tax=Steinernema hermaphroditum TaxID=289476 RepID=A0AA39LU90_9BILA|nr:hypothetical protein QR680_005085 [Steinernema hermaphroditum]